MSNTIKRGRKKLSESEKMKPIGVLLEPNDKRILILEAYRYQLTLSKLLRVLLTNAIDIQYRHATVMTPTDPSQYFMLWGQRFIVLLGTYYESMVRFGFSDQQDIESLLQVQKMLPIVLDEELKAELETIRSGTLKFNVPNTLREAIEREAKNRNITISDFVRSILRKHIDLISLLQSIEQPLNHSSRSLESHKKLSGEMQKTLLELGRQASAELSLLALTGVRPNQPFRPTQLIKKA